MSVKLSNNPCSDCPVLKQSVFADADQGDLEIISQLRTVNHHQKGQAIFLQDNPSFGVFCIQLGKAKIVKADSSGNESIVRLVKAGSMIGHSSAFLDENFHASAIAIEKCTVCFIDKKAISEIISRAPLIALNIIKSLGASLKSAELIAASKTQQNVREKLANLFLSLVKNNGIKIGDTYKLDIKLTREELASIIGSTTETVCRFITEFKQEGLIEEHDKTLYIMNVDKLMKFANNY